MAAASICIKMTAENLHKLVKLMISGAILVASIQLLAIGASKIYVKGVMVYGEKFKWSHLSAMFKK